MIGRLTCRVLSLTLNTVCTLLTMTTILLCYSKRNFAVHWERKCPEVFVTTGAMFAHNNNKNCVCCTFLAGLFLFMLLLVRFIAICFNHFYFQRIILALESVVATGQNWRKPDLLYIFFAHVTLWLTNVAIQQFMVEKLLFALYYDDKIVN